MTKTTRLAVALLSSVVLTGITAPAFAQSGEVNIYSYREQSLLQPLLDKFSAETGIKANVLYAGDGLLERVAAEGELSPADVVLTVDIGNLVGAEEQGLTQPITTPALAEKIGVSMALFDDNFLTVLRNGMVEQAKGMDGVELQVEDAQNDVAKQQSQIQNFIAAGVSAIIVNPVDTDATAAMSKIAADAGIPLVYVNREPVNVDSLPDGQAFVASDETVAGTLEAKEVCRLLGGKGNAVIMMGELSNQAARMRTQSAKDVLKTDECKGIQIVEEQTANWQRTQGADLMTNWLSSGVEFDAVISNNDEMAIGAIQALKAAGKDMKDVVVAGVDATQDALAAMQAGDLDVTVFQDAAGQGKGALDAALKLAKGEDVESMVWIPFELVTPANMEQYLSKN